jgi:hypothetical protein
MPRRQRWTPVKGTATRVASPAERALLAAADLPSASSGALPSWTDLRWRRTACGRSSSCVS